MGKKCSSNNDDESFEVLPFGIPVTRSTRERFVRLVDAFLSVSNERQSGGDAILPVSETPTILDAIEAFTLNVEQAAAFTILASQLMSSDMKSGDEAHEDERYIRAANTLLNIQQCTGESHNSIIHGPAGTGKSRVIQALQHFADRWYLKHTILVTATTGAAAVLLGAQTYHSALKLNSRCQNSASKVPQELRNTFLQLRLFIIDEMSMLGTRALLKIDSRLKVIRGVPEKPFGGLPIVLIGDFMQLQPVQDSPLYVPRVGHGRQCQRIASDFYQAQFNAAVCLTQSMRMRTAAVTVIEGLRQPPPSLQAVQTLNSRHIEIPQSLPWFPIATQTNETRLRIIRSNTYSAARTTRVFALKANFHLKGKLDSNQKQTALRLLMTAHDSILGYLPPVLNICIGMHVMVTNNCSPWDRQWYARSGCWVRLEYSGKAQLH